MDGKYEYLKLSFYCYNDEHCEKDYPEIEYEKVSQRWIKNEPTVIELINRLQNQTDIINKIDTDKSLFIADGESLILELFMNGDYQKWKYANLNTYSSFLEENGLDNAELNALIKTVDDIVECIKNI